MTKGEERGRIMVDHGRYATMRRPAMYAITNAVVIMQTEAERAYGLRPADLQIYMLIGVAGVQRVIRTRPIPEIYAGDAPLPLSILSGISRRQLAALTGLSRDAVNRATKRLIGRGLVVEASRGKLAHAPGTLELTKSIHHPDAVLAPFVAMFEELLRLGVLRLADPDHPTA